MIEPGWERRLVLPVKGGDLLGDEAQLIELRRRIMLAKRTVGDQIQPAAQQVPKAGKRLDVQGCGRVGHERRAG